MGGVMAVLKGALLVLSSAVTTVILPFLAIAGAVMGVIAIFKHLDFIASSLWEAMKMVANAFSWLHNTMRETMANMFAGLMGILAKIPGIGGMFKGAEDHFRREAEKAGAERLAAEKRLAENAAIIADNTAKSWQRTQEDAAMLKSMLTPQPVTSPQGGSGGSGANPTAFAPTMPEMPFAPAVAQLAPEATAAVQGTKTNTGTIVTQNSTIAAQVTASNAKMTGLQQQFVRQIAQDARLGGRTIAALTSISNKVSALASLTGAINGLKGTAENILTKLGTGVKIIDTLGGGQGGPGPFGELATKHGLSLTSGYRPGDKGYHGVNRARDYSNVTEGSKGSPEMLKFARRMASSYGKNLKELIYTPLGYSIKNGQKVDPYATADHYDHVHVAWNGGNVAPLLDEMKYKPVGSTLGVANSSEAILNKGQTALLANALKSGGTVVNNTIHIDGAQDPEAVAQAILNAMTQIEQSTIA
jgi:hypothetical protein